MKLRSGIKSPNIWNLHPDSIIVKYCSGILINREIIVNHDLSESKIEKEPEIGVCH